MCFRNVLQNKKTKTTKKTKKKKKTLYHRSTPMGVDNLRVGIAPKELYERPLTGPKLFSMDFLTLLITNDSFHKPVWSTLDRNCVLSVDHAFGES